MGAMETVTNTMSLLFGGIAAISLLVGGIGIMNIMLVSVTERTREIGIRKAIGAARSSILMQFLVEALMLSLMGCIIGLFLSWFILSIANVLAGDMATFTMSFGVIALALGFSVLIGVAFGLYPANKAAKLQPIQALRHD
jgi:putative ABC transport system permease protein